MKKIMSCVLLLQLLFIFSMEAFASSRCAIATSNELESNSKWDKTLLSKPRLPIQVATLSEIEQITMAKPRFHQALPVYDQDGNASFPLYVQTNAKGHAVPSEKFHVRMMPIKGENNYAFVIPNELTFLMPFIRKVWDLEYANNPEGFAKRYAYIQVDASLVEANENQERPGKTTTQSPDLNDRKGAHVDGYLMPTAREMNEDTTYSMSLGFDPTANSLGDHVPTEFFEFGFTIPDGISHREARVLFDKQTKINSERGFVTYPQSAILRMGSRVVHRVGVAKKRTYRIFAKIKFSDEVFFQVGNTINTSPLAIQSIYDQWEQQGIPLVSRETLPTEGQIAPADRQIVGGAPSLRSLGRKK